jgi:hypothetical protein
LRDDFIPRHVHFRVPAKHVSGQQLASHALLASVDYLGRRRRRANSLYVLVLDRVTKHDPHGSRNSYLVPRSRSIATVAVRLGSW